MVHRNPCIARLKAGYLFPEIRKRKEAFLQRNPHADLISLGVGDTTEPLAEEAVNGIVDEANALGTVEGYRGYPPEAGEKVLRQAIATTIYQGKVSEDDIFVSDGSKCDVGRLQQLFGQDVSIAIQDPVYPVYMDTSLILGQQRIELMSCKPENQFFPVELPDVDLIFFCSPNNPTGALATEEQLKRLVSHAKECGAIILFDAAYAAFVREGVRSIYEIPGAEEVAIEMGSFSKMAGFTGVRLGWTVVPEALSFSCGHSVRADWLRLITTFFNGPSRLSMAAGLNMLSEKGLCQIEERVAFYLENAKIISNALKEAGMPHTGGEHIPYLWATLPGLSSWELFERFLEELHILTIPGSGFGQAGEGFVRFSAFAHREQALTAAKRIKEVSHELASWLHTGHHI